MQQTPEGAPEVKKRARKAAQISQISTAEKKKGKEGGKGFKFTGSAKYTNLVFYHSA
tara:strand:- start:941 stop:1111 length:171 start_codon:yes stop_codon:yes gene_type:complete